MRTFRVLVALLAFLRITYADTFTVNSTTDAVDANPGDGTCATAGSVCTLRAAIQEANAHAGDDTIDVPAGTYLLTIPPGAETTAALDASVGDLDITANATITGVGSGLVTIDGGGTTRVFHIAASQTVTMSGITVKNGADQGGGGILALGNLTLNDVVVTQNTSNGGAGGGIRGGGALTLSDSTVSDNGSTDQGGGIFGGTPVMIDRSTISGNHTPDQGGGIFSDGPLTITSSTVSGNMSTGDQGGGIFIENGALTIVNSTISGNSASDTGGGIFNNPPLGPATNPVRILNTTISANSATSGGGVFTFDPGVIGLRNSLLAANVGSSGSPDAGGMVGSEGYNLIGNTSGATITGDTTGNVTGQAPGIGALADNGGPTATHALLPGSPALDGGDPAGCVDAASAALTTDQRGAPRPQGPRCDIGSVEGTGSVGSTTTTTTTLPPTCDGVPRAATFASIDCRLDTLIAEVNASTSLGALATRLQNQLQKARDRKEQADGFCRQPNVRRTRQALKKAIRKMVVVGKTLRSRKARNSIPDPLRQQLLTDAGDVLVDLRALKGALQCPAGA